VTLDKPDHLQFFISFHILLEYNKKQVTDFFIFTYISKYIILTKIKGEHEKHKAHPF